MDRIDQDQTGGTLITVTRDGDRLFAQWSGQPTLELTQTGEHEFVNAPAQAHVSFASSIMRFHPLCSSEYHTARFLGIFLLQSILRSRASWISLASRL